VVVYNEYYPFGMLLPNRHASSAAYRYGFNGMEKDDELKGIGNSYDFGARMLDPRVGRWFKMDNEFSRLPDLTPYGYVNGNPIRYIDPDGNFLIDVHRRIMRNAFSRSKRGRSLVFSSRTSSRMKHNPALSRNLINYRESIDGTHHHNRSAIDDYNGSVVGPDVKSLPKKIGGGGMPSISSQHFDNMNYDEIIINLSSIDNEILSLTTLYTDGKISSTQLGEKVGEHFHAIQDLYSHSNYVELYKAMYGETDITEIPTFDEAQSQEKYKDFAYLLETSLKTGIYDEESGYNGKGSHRDLNHDKGKGTSLLYSLLRQVVFKKVNWNTRAAEELATKATVKLNDKIESKIK
jgi:RHS repeat-associated protein